MMGKYLVSMRYLISTICIVLLLWGCDRTVDATAQPKVVHKKVVVQKEQTAKASRNKTIRTARTTDAATKPGVVRKKVVAQKEQIAKARNLVKEQTMRNRRRMNMGLEPLSDELIKPAILRESVC